MIGPTCRLRVTGDSDAVLNLSTLTKFGVIGSLAALTPGTSALRWRLHKFPPFSRKRLLNRIAGGTFRSTIGGAK